MKREHRWTCVYKWPFTLYIGALALGVRRQAVVQRFSAVSMGGIFVVSVGLDLCVVLMKVMGGYG